VKMEKSPKNRIQHAVGDAAVEGCFDSIFCILTSEFWLPGLEGSS